MSIGPAGVLIATGHGTRSTMKDINHTIGSKIVIRQFETFSIVLWLAIILVLDVSCASNNQLKSRGVEINQNLAFRSVAERRDAERRAVAGDVEAAKELGDCCLYVDNDFAAAKRWFKLAASYGDKDAKASLKTLDDIEKGKD